MSEFLQSYLIPALVFFFGGYFAVKTRFFPLKHPVLFIRSLLYKGDKDSHPLKALGVALAGTLGVGNIVGVVGAVKLGGAGAIFWMWVSALFAMMLKYAETVLSMRYVKKDEKGSHGGGMYYISSRKWGIIFTLLCLICSFVLGGAIQSDALAVCTEKTLGLDGTLICLAMAALCFAVIYGGKKGIFNFASKLVPFMSVLYGLMCIIVILSSSAELPRVMEDIFKGAFSARGVMGGGFFAAVKYGTIRGLISNEAGCGTAPIAHASSGNPSPASQGCLGIAEVFIDTVVLCTLTGFCILLHPSKVDGMEAVLSAFHSVFGDLSLYLITASVALFAFATQICWGYYGAECIHFLFPKSKKAGNIYTLLFCISIFALRPLGDTALWQGADLIIALMALINMTALFKKRREVISESRLLFK